MATMDIRPHLIKYLAKTREAYKYIDQFYYENINQIQEDNLSEIDNLYRLSKLTIEAQYYLRKILLLCGQDSGDGDVILFEIIKKTFKRAYDYVVSIKTLKMSSYFRKRYNGVYSDSILAEFLSMIMFANFLRKKIDLNDSIYDFCLKMIYSTNQIVNDFRLSHIKYNNYDEVFKSVLNKIESTLKENYFMHGYNLRSIHHLIDKKDCLIHEANSSFELNIPKIKNDIYSKVYLSYSYIDNELQKATMRDLFEDINIDSDIIKSMINYYILLNGLSESINLSNCDNIDYEELSFFISTSLIQCLYIEAYNKASVFFFKNHTEQINNTLIKTDNKLKEVQKERDYLISENSILKEQLKEISKKLSNTESKLEKIENNNKELFELRTYIFNNQELDKNFEEETPDISFLKNKKVLCFGGNQIWISNMKEMFKDWTYVSSESINFDVNILKNADLVCIKVTHISHTMYHKIMNNIDKNSKIKFINNTNINKIINSLTEDK